ncbi:MAG TPA: hypothetical protein DCQ06_06265 [Myxococcales bacterium]|nr:hypothetical protein [Myxococcales bacterium]
MVLSSGSSGRPQANKLTASQLLHSLLGSVERLGHAASDRWLCPLPLHHVGGFCILVRTAWLSTCAEILPRFDKQRCISRLASGEVTLISVTPGWLDALVTDWSEQGQGPSQNLRAILVGGAALPTALRQRAETLKLPIAESWGMSETASQIATSSPSEPLVTLGIPILHTADVSSQGDNQLWVHGPLTPEGLLATRDKGQVLQGHVQLQGRADRVFQVGGENVSALEVERIAKQLQGVADVQAVPIPDKRYGNIVALLFEALPPVRVEALEAYMMRQLQAFKVPKVWIQVDELPKSSLGKKSVARAIHVAQRALQPLDRDQDLLGQRTALTAEAIDASVNVANHGVLDAALITTNREDQGHRTFADALERDTDVDAQPQGHRNTVIRLCVDQRHHPIALGHNVMQGQTNLDEHGLKSSVGHLESSGKERNSGGVDLDETDPMSMSDHCTTPISSAQEPIERRVRANEGEPLR